MNASRLLPLIFLGVFGFYANAQQLATTKPMNNKHPKAKSNNDPSRCIKDLSNIQNCGNCCDVDFIIYDLKCKTFYIVNHNDTIRVSRLSQIKIRYNKELKFKILNVNRYIYDVNFAVDDIEFGSEPPPLFKQLFLGEGDYLTALLEKLKSEQIARAMGAQTPVDTFLNEFNNFRKTYDLLIDNQIKAYNYCETYECCTQGRNIKFSTISSKITMLKIAYENARLFVNNKLNNLQPKIDKNFKSLNDCRNALKKKAVLEDSLKMLLVKYPGSKRINPIKTDIENLNCDTTRDLLEIKTHGYNITSYNIQKETLEKIWNSIIKPTDEQIMKLVLFNNNLVAEHFSYTAPPIYPQGNRIRFGLRISPRDSLHSLISKWNIMPLYNDSISFDLPVLYKPYVSFSTGPFLGFSKNLYNESYAWQPQPDNHNIIPDSAQFKLVSTGRIYNPIGFAAMANIGTKFSSFFGLAGSIGVGVTVENKPRPAYLGGISLFIGNKQQFTVTYGIAAIQMDRLKSDLYLDMTKTLYNSNPGDISYTKKLEFGQFISITYTAFTLGNTRASSSKSKK